VRPPPTLASIVRACLLIPCLAGALAACRVPEAGLHVVVEGALRPGEDFDRLSLVAYLAGARTPLHVETLEGEALSLPATFNLLSGQGTPPGTAVHLLASAERAGQVVSAARAEGVLLAGEGGRVTLQLPPPGEGIDGGSAAVEACGTGDDEDGDGLVDCADPDCAERPCGPGGMSCVSGACGCAAGPVGVWKQPLTGFVPREGAQVVMLSSGPRGGWMAVVGGTGADGNPRAEVELLRPVINQVEVVQLTGPRSDPGLAELPGGGLAVVGGVGPGGMLQQDLVLLTFGAAGATALAVPFAPELGAAPAVALGGDGTLLLTGGTLQDRLVRVDVGQPENGAPWEDLTTLGAARSAAAPLDDGRWILAGGPSDSVSVDVVQADGGVVSGPPLPVAVSGAAVARVAPGRVLVVGGQRAFLLEAHGPTVSVRETGGLPLALASPRAVALQDGWVYVHDTEGSAAFWFDPAAGAFVAASPLPAPRQGDALGAFERSVYRFGGGTQAGLDGLVHVLERRCPGS
jgi:hypothetical protein